MRPLTLGALTVETPIALGPMAGVTDLPFRLLAAEMGCGMFYTEMVSAKAIWYHNRNTEGLMHTGSAEHPVGLQLFGSDPDIIAETALSVEDRFDFIDLNMGCPVPKVVKNGEGSALLKNLPLTDKILAKLVKTVHKPVTVKTRIGFQNGETQSLELARIAEAAGVSMITLHARTREQYYSGKADWSMIRKLKESVSIPVIGNGDITCGPDAVKMVAETGCDGVMIGRGAEGNPWIFREVRAALEGKEIPARPSDEEIRTMILRHADLLVWEKGEHIAMLEMRKHAAWYLQGKKDAAELRRKISQVTGMDELISLVQPKY